jgi:GAF domain-containing protein
MTHSDPVHDAARLQEIVDLGLLEADVGPLLYDIAERAAAALGQPVSLVSVVLDEALHVASAAGVAGMWMTDVGGHPLEWSFCKTSVQTRDAFVVPNAVDDPVHRDNPLVTIDGVRCYAGVPMISSRGFVLGNLCVVGVEPRSFSEQEMATLRTLAAEAVSRLESRRKG